MYSAVIGFYMRFEDDSIESAKVVKQWNVKIISVSVTLPLVLVFSFHLGFFRSFHNPFCWCALVHCFNITRCKCNNADQQKQTASG